MTLDEAIKRFSDNAEYEQSHGSLQGCLEFRQLAEWLVELKELKEQTKQTAYKEGYDAYKRIMTREKQFNSYCPPCEDAISRAEAMNALDALYLDGESAQGFTADANGDCLIGKHKAIEILDELPSVQPHGLVHIDDIYRLISGHSNYHGDSILAALTCLAEGKEVPNPITVLSVQPEQQTGLWIHF